MNKKSVELAMNTIIIAVIVIVVALIIIFIFRYYYGKETGIIGEQIEGLQDSDGDGIVDMFDKCPDNPDPNCEGESKEDESEGTEGIKRIEE